AAGLACCTSEMPARAGTGMDVELGRVPQREVAMTPYEILLSESQERMLLVAVRGREEEVGRIFAKWELDAVEIGRVTAAGTLTVRLHGRVVAHVPVNLLAEAPRYTKPRATRATSSWTRGGAPPWRSARRRATSPARAPRPSG